MELHSWSCPICGIDKQPAEDSGDAMAKLEVHEQEAHKGKQVGSWGASGPDWGKPLTAEDVALYIPWSTAPFPFKAKVFADGTCEVKNEQA